MVAGDGEFTGELDLSNVLDGGVEVLGGTVGIDVSEEVGRLDGVVPRTGLSEIVSGGN